MNKAGRTSLIVAGALVLAAGAGAAGYALGTSPSDSAPLATVIADGDPRIVTSSELRELAPLLGTIYWAGEREDTKLELTVDGGTVTLRYLSNDVKVGADVEALTIATYRDLAGYQALQELENDEASVTEADSGALIAVPANSPKSTYFAFPSGAFEVEVFSPREGESFTLVSEGDVSPVPAADTP